MIGLRRGAILAAILLTAIPGPAAADKLEERLERFREQTAMISVTRRDRSVARGAGAVLCQEDGRAYVLATYHLLAGETPGDQELLRRPARTEVRFYGDDAATFVDDRSAPPQAGEPGSLRGVTLFEKRDFRGVSEKFSAADANLRDNPIGNDTVSSVRLDPDCRVELFEHVDYEGRSTVLTHDTGRLSGTDIGNDAVSSLEVSCGETDEQRMGFHAAAEDDLVLLSVPRTTPLALTAATRLGFFDLPSIRWHEQPDVFVVGHPRSSRETWVGRQGTLLAGGGRLLHYSAEIDEGFSGAPLFNKKALIGVHLRLVSGEEIGAAAGVYGEALSVKQVLEAIEEWLPERCRQRIGGRVDHFLPSVDSAPRTAELEEMKVKGRLSYREELRFGDSRVTAVHRRSIEAGTALWQQAYGFSFDESDGIRWLAECSVGPATSRPRPESDGEISLELASGKPLSCELERRGGETAARIVLLGRSAADRGTEEPTSAGAVRVDVAEVRAGYQFYAGERLIGAVETRAGGTVWLHPAAQGELRSAVLVASAALLLNPDPD